MAECLMVPTFGELPGCDVIQKKPWLLEIWEPLNTKAPNPNLAQPYCCYFATVIFYVRPYTVRPWHRIVNWRHRYEAEKPGMAFEEWGRCEHVLRWDTPVQWNGETFLTGGGRVIWKNKRWWMRHWARRKQENAAAREALSTPQQGVKQS